MESMTTTTRWSGVRCQKCQLSVAMRAQSEFSNRSLCQFCAISFWNTVLVRYFGIRQMMDTVGAVFRTIDTNSGTCIEYQVRRSKGAEIESKVKNDWLWCKKVHWKKLQLLSHGYCNRSLSQLLLNVHFFKCTFLLWTKWNSFKEEVILKNLTNV